MTATLSNKKRRKFGRAAILPPNQRSVIQCTSTAGPGVTISYLTVTWRPYTATITGEDGTVTPQTNVELANLPTVTVVQSSAATVYAPPVNGYNIVKRQTGVSATDTTATTTLRTTPPPPPGEASNDMPTQVQGTNTAPQRSGPARRFSSSRRHCWSRCWSGPGSGAVGSRRLLRSAKVSTLGGQLEAAETRGLERMGRKPTCSWPLTGTGHVQDARG